MGVQNPNSTNYVHSDEPNLLNLHKAMQYNQVGEPELRVHVDGINLEGNVLVSNVSIDSGNITVWQGTDPWTVDGNVGVSGNVSISQMPAITGNVSITDGGGSITVDGNVSVTGNITTTPSNTVSTIVSYDPSPKNTQLDVTGRLRVATNSQNWWYVPSIDKDGDLRYNESTSGTAAAVIWLQYLAAVDLTSGTDSNGYTVRASRRRHKMRPGVGHQWYGIANFCGRQTNVVKRLGMFTPFNGIFYELTDTDLVAVIRRRLPDGTLVERRIPRTEFNVDRLDGSANYNPSGYNFNTSRTISLTGHVSTTVVTAGSTTVWNVVYAAPGINVATWPLGTRVTVSGVSPTTYNNCPMIAAVDQAQGRVTLTYSNNPGVYSSMSSAQIYHDGFHNEHSFFFEFSGSRTNTVRFMLQGPSGPQTLHIEHFGNSLGSQYENAPALMERAEIQNVGPVNHLPAFNISGTAFNVEADVELNPGFGVASNNTGVTFIKQQTQEFAILGVGLRAGEPYQRADLQIQRVQITDLGNVNPQNSGLFYWRLLFNPTLGGDFSGNGSATQILCGKASRLWHFTTSTTFSGGIELFSGYAQATTTIEVQTALNFLNLGSNIAYTDADKVVLVVKQLVGGTDNASIVASINFIEAL